MMDAAAMLKPLEMMCHREPGVEEPMKNSPLYPIWKAFYKELALSEEELVNLSNPLTDDGLHSDVIPISRLSYAIGLEKELRYLEALDQYKALADENAFEHSIQWHKHLSWRLELLSVKVKPAYSKMEKATMLWEVIQRWKSVFEQSGEWRECLWIEMEGIKALRMAGQMDHAEWTEANLKVQATYYKWDELAAAMETLEKPSRSPFENALDKTMEEANSKEDLSIETHLAIMKQIKTLKEWGAVDAFAEYCDRYSLQLEQRARYKEANEVLRLWVNR